jgi:hypothetical protein
MIRKSSVSPARRALIDLMFEVYFGSIESLVIAGGEPVLRPAPRVARDVRLGRRDTRRPVRDRTDFTLKAQHVELLQHFDALRDGLIDRIDVQAGLPFRIRLAQAA